MKKYLLLAYILFIATTVFAQADIEQRIVDGRKNDPSQEKKPYVILISADGFRWDYAEKYHATHLLALAGSGVKAESMIPSYPSVTFPNHYSIVTGLYPSHQGIVNNAFYDVARKDSYSMSNTPKVVDGTWYGGTPLWVLAEQQHMLAASFYWVASEAAIQGVRPTYYYTYSEKIAMGDRIKAVTDWLKLPEDKRPHFITFYFPQVDHAGHSFGPDAPQTEEQVHVVDNAIDELTKAVKATGLDVNFIFVSDHGMTKIDTEHGITIPGIIDPAKFLISGDGTLVELYAKDATAIQETYNKLKEQAGADYTVYLKTNVPAYLHYGKADDVYNRIGDILLIPTWPKVFNLNNRRLSPGTHGFDPSVVKDMHATFFAWGPAFKSYVTVSSFPNVDVFPLVTDILGLTYINKIDGTQQLAKQVLK